MAVWIANPIIMRGFTIPVLHETDNGERLGFWRELHSVSANWTGSYAKQAGACMLTWQRSENWKAPDTILTS